MILDYLSEKESAKNNVVYHNSYSDAVSEILAFAIKNGFATSEDDVFTQISSGPKKPSEGVTNKFHLDLYKDEKLSKKKLHAQVYGTGDKYELNMYIF